MTAKTVIQSGESKKNKYVWRGVWSDETPGRGEQTMKISRVHGVWILKAKGVCLYFPSLEELIRKARMLLESL